MLLAQDKNKDQVETHQHDHKHHHHCHHESPKEHSTSSSNLNNFYNHILKDKDARKLTILLVINLTVTFLELIYGFLSNSIGLISDAAHMLFDSTALAVGIYASYKAKLPSNVKFSYGYERFQTLAGFVNGIFLIFIAFYILIESLERIYNPPVIHSEKMIVVAIIGLVVNVIGVLFFHEHAHFHGDDEGHSCSHHHKHEHNHHELKSNPNHENQHHSHKCKHSTKKHLDSGFRKVSLADNIDSHDNGDVDSSASTLTTIKEIQSLQDTEKFKKSTSHQCHHDHNNHHHHSHIDDHHDHHADQSQLNTENIHKEHHHHEHQNHHHDEEGPNENLYGVFLHILADLLGSVGVISSSILILLFGWYTADAICSAITSVLILASVVPLLKSSAMTFMQTYPAKYEKEFHQILTEISNHPSIIECKEPHLWAFTHDKLICSLRLILKHNTPGVKEILEFSKEKLRKLRKIKQITIDYQVEPSC